MEKRQYAKTVPLMSFDVFTSICSFAPLTTFSLKAKGVCWCLIPTRYL